MVQDGSEEEEGAAAQRPRRAGGGHLIPRGPGHRWPVSVAVRHSVLCLPIGWSRISEGLVEKGGDGWHRGPEQDRICRRGEPGGPSRGASPFHPVLQPPGAGSLTRDADKSRLTEHLYCFLIRSIRGLIRLIRTLGWSLKGKKRLIINDSYNGNRWNVMKSIILKQKLILKSFLCKKQHVNLFSASNKTMRKIFETIRNNLYGLANIRHQIGFDITASQLVKQMSTCFRNACWSTRGKITWCLRCAWKFFSREARKDDSRDNDWASTGTTALPTTRAISIFKCVWIPMNYTNSGKETSSTFPTTNSM